MSKLFELPPWLEEVADWFYRISIRPRETMRDIIDIHPAYWQKELLIAVILVNGLTPIYQGVLILLNLILNALLYGVSVYATAGLVWIIGKPLGGKATFTELSTAVVWSFVPIIVIMAFGLLLSFFGEGVYAAGRIAGMFSIFDLVALLFALWSFKLIVFTVAEVQDFTFWRATANLSLATVAMILPLLPFLIMLWAMMMSRLATGGGLPLGGGLF